MGAFAFVVWLICLILNIYLAKKKNRSIAAWVILSIFFSWIALIVLLILRPKLPENTNTGYQAKQAYPYVPPKQKTDELTRSMRQADEPRQDVSDNEMLDKVSAVIKNTAKKTRKVSTNCKACGAPLIGRHDQFVVCEYCGTGVRLNEDEEP